MTPRVLDPGWLSALVADRRERERAQVFYVEGTRFVHAALAHGSPILGIAHAPELLTDPSGQRLVRVLRRGGVPIVRLAPDAFRALSLLGEPQGIGAVVPMRWGSLHAPFEPRGLWLGLDAIRSPGNLGTMLRTASAAGATGAFFAGDGADPFDPRCVRATMGAVFSLRLARAGDRTLHDWRRRGGRVVGADGDPSTSVDSRRASYRGATAILLGAERRGLTPRQRASCDRLVSIPMCAGIDSLNVAAAAAVLLYEAHRQRAPCGPQRLST